MDDKFLNEALKEARKAYKKDEIPVGCVIVYDGNIVARGHNLRERKQNSLMHAEIMAVDRACKYFNSWRLDDCVMYVTLEPCMMCLGAIIESRIKKVVYGTKNNSEQMYVCVKNIDLIHANSKECSDILTDFFKNKRKK